MSLFSLLLNILWIAFGGLWMAVAWIVAAVIMAITIIGLPWARAAINIGLYTLLPFGQKAVSRAEYSGAEDVGTGLLGFIGNQIGLSACPGHGRQSISVSIRCSRSARRPCRARSIPALKTLAPGCWDSSAIRSDYRPALGTGGNQYRSLYAAPVRPEGRVARGVFRR